MTNTFPTIINPNEALDGALVGWNAIKAIETYSMQNNGTIKGSINIMAKTSTLSV